MVILDQPGQDTDGDDNISEEEVGGENGREALPPQNIVRPGCRPVSHNPEESFEIVKRRHRPPRPSRGALARISATANAVVVLPPASLRSSPAGHREHYIDRIRATLPSSPGTVRPALPGVGRLGETDNAPAARLMNFHRQLALARSNISAPPLIMPGSVPLRDADVIDRDHPIPEDQWKVIIDTDVDGTNAAPTQVDQGTTQISSGAFVTQQLARTVFVGTPPEQRHKGIHKQRAFLELHSPATCPATSTPRSTNSRTRRPTFILLGISTGSTPRPTPPEHARDYAERLTPRKCGPKSSSGYKTTQPICGWVRRRPRSTGSSADVPDGQGKPGWSSCPGSRPRPPPGRRLAACRWATEVLERRGSGARTHRNMLVFLAADAARYDELRSRFANTWHGSMCVTTPMVSST